MPFERLHDALRTLVRCPSSTCAKSCLWSLGYVRDERKGYIIINYEDLPFLEQDQGQAEPPKIMHSSIDYGSSAIPDSFKVCPPMRLGNLVISELLCNFEA